MTRYNLVPADDPSSIESFLRLRRSQLDGGRPPMIRGTREAAECQSAEHDAERVLDLLRRMPPEEYITAADAGPKALEAAQYDWLRRHGLERGRVDAALGARRRSLTQQVHRVRSSSVADPAVTAAGGAPGRGRGTGPSTRARPPAAVAQLTAADRRGMLANVAAARAAGRDPDQLYPGWRDRILASTPNALVAAGSGMTTAEYNRWERDRAARQNLASRWRVLNERFFGGALPIPDFKVAYINDLLAEARDQARNRLNFAAWYDRDHRPGRGTITVRASEVADDGVLVHEMVHQWMDHRGLPSGHGDEFIRRANLIAQGSELPFVHDPTRWPHDQALAASGAAAARCGVGSRSPDRPFLALGPPVSTSSGATTRGNQAPGRKPSPTGGAASFNTVSGPRAGARPGPPGTGGSAGRVVVDSGADRSAPRATGRRSR